jgi:hypothetical protein
MPEAWTHALEVALCVLCTACIDWGGPSRLDGGSDAPQDAPPDGADAACPAGQAFCEGACIDVMSNHDHCGSCQNACEPFEVCADGSCSLECPSGLLACDGGCVDVSSDVNHCGRCDTVCTAGMHASPVCDDRVCTVRCDGGWSDLDGDGACETECVPSAGGEVCNGVDDDCDGETDEDFDCRMGQAVSCETVCGSAGTGACAYDCRPPAPDGCDPPAELCNGEDDDCDGACDNGFACCRSDSEFCTTACGSSGMRACTAVCQWSSCLPPPEACNGADDDCDGACDNGFACCRGGSGSCTTSCGSTGTHACSSSCTWEECVPPAETCNGADDDCDGICDDGFGCCGGSVQGCPTSCGSTGSMACSAACAWGPCVPPAETCNGADDDCDGDVDEDYRQWRCPLSGSVVASQDACNAGCAVTQDCTVTTTTPSASGTATYVHACRLRVQASGTTITFQQEQTDWEGSCNGSFASIGTLTLAGATVTGTATYAGGCRLRVQASGTAITFQQEQTDWEGSCNGSFASIGTLTLAGVTTQTCPLGGAYPCSGTPPRCTQSASCEAVIVCG